jgi:hypothetical protein
VSTYTYAETFTRTHARRLAGRVTSDLRQCHLLYGVPSESSLVDYCDELEELLVGNYVFQYDFGFKRAGRLVWSMRYIVGPDGALTSASLAGGVPVGIDVAGARYFNFVSYSVAWSLLSSSQKAAIEQRLPFQRTDGTLPDDTYGTWTKDRTYTAGGVALDRSVFRSFR